MIGKNNHYLRDTKDGTKVESYSIKKFKVGAASVVIGASIFLGAGAVAQASEEVSNNTTADNTTNVGAKENVPTAPVATAQPVAKETTKEDVAAGLAAKLGGEVKALDKTKLENYIAEIEGKLANGAYDNKTEESVAVLKEELKAAKATLADATTQDEITKAYSKLVTTANTKLKAKPVEKKETPAVDTTNGKETVGKKAENTEKRSESNSIENTGSKDPRNGKALDKNNAFRAETTERSGNFNYSMEYSNGKKDIYLYNEEEANVNITVSSTAGNITKATVKGGSGQFLLKSKSDQAIAFTKFGRGSMPPEEEVETDGFGWSYRQTLTETEGPVTINITGKPNDTFKAIDSYTKTENQEAVLGSRFLQLKDSTNAELRGGRGASDPGYFRLVVKSQTYKYDIQLPESNADKIAVSNVDNLTEADITKIKNEIKIKYSDKATTEDARLASKNGEVLANKSTVVQDVAVAGGTVTVTYKDGSVDTTSVSSVARTNETPTVSIPFSDPTPDKKDIYIYNGEEVDIDITFNDDSGKIQSAALKRGGNQDLKDIGENKQDNEWGLVTTVIKNETTTPATIKITGTVTGVPDNKIPKTETQALPIVSRFATATDLDGKYIENQATKFNLGTSIVSESYKTDPGAFTITLKAQTAKYDIKTPASADKVTVSDANNISNEDFEKIKEKVKIEYSKNNIDMRLADKKGKEVENPTERVERIEREGNNVVVTYKDGSKDTKALADFVNVAPKVALPYSNEANKQIYVYTGENTDLTFKGTDENEVKDLYLRGPGDISGNNAAGYGLPTGKVENGAVTGEGSVSEDKRTATIKMTGKTNLPAGQEWTSFIVSKDNDGKLSNTDYRALDKDPNARQKPGYAHFLVKNQTFKYDIAAPTEKVAVTDPANVTEDDLAKIKEKLQLEYNKKNDDANISKDSPVTDKDSKIKSLTKDADGNLVVTYKDGSTDKRPLSEFVTLDKQPAIDAVNNAAQAKIDEINKTPNATDDEKQAAIDKVNADKKKALDEIAKPEVTTKEALDTAKTAGTTAIVGDNPVVAKKDAAKADVETARKAKEDAIKANPNLTQAEKDAAIAKNNTAAEEAIKAIDSATTNDAVDKAKEAGTGEIAKVNPVAKAAAKKAVADELAEKEKAIDARTDLTDAEKTAAKDDAKAKAKAATDAINAQPDNAETPEAATTAQTAVNNAKDKGVADVKAVNPVAKEAAKKAVADELAKKEEAIDKRTDLTDEEKAAAKDDAKAKAKAATDAIDAQPSNATTPEEAEKAQTAVNGAKDKGVADVTAVNPVAAKKSAAKADVETARKAKEDAIKANPNLTQAEKDAAIAKNNTAAEEATKAIDSATTNDAVDKAKEAGTGEIAKVNPVAKEAAKKAIADELAKKEEAIDARTDLTDAEKAKAKEDAQAKAKEATDAINAQPDNAETPEKAAEAQTAVNGAKDKGVADVKAVNPVAKEAAKKAIADELAKKEEAINGRTDLTDEEKAAAKKDAQDKAKEATDAINAQPDNAATPEEAEKAQTAVNGAKDKGVADVKAVNPEAKAKPEAKKAIDEALKAKEDAIDARTDLTDDEKKAAKEAAKEEADKAKEAVDAAPSNAEVDKAKEAGTGAVEAINPEAKAKPEAKKAVDDALKAKVDAIDAREDLTPAEKQAAKDKAAEAAKKAKEAIDAATTDAAVDTAKTAGTGEIAKVNPVAKAAAKKAVADELAKKEKAIDGRTDLTDAEKAAAKKDAQDKAKEATDAINTQPDNAETPEKATEAQTAVDGAKDKGVADVKAVNPVAKAAAKKAIADELAKKEEAIDGRTDLTDEEKAAAKKDAQDKAKEATDAIDAQPSNVATPEEAEKAQTAVNGAKDKGVADVKAVDPAAAKKPEAKKAVDDALKAKVAAIDAREDLTPAEKQAAKEKAAEEAKKAKEAIDAATTDAAVDKAKEAGTGEIAKVNPVAKEAAKKAIADELAKKEEAIDGRTDLTDEEKAAAKKDAQDKAKEATDAINAQPDSVATPEEAAKAKTAVDGAKDKGVADVKAVNPVAKAKPEAKKAIDDKLAKQLEDIANTPDATDEEKKVAADAAKALADQAKKDIDNAKKDEDVKKLQDEAKEEIEKSVPVVEDKPNARKAIEDEAKAKKAAIDARTDLTPKAKEDLKAEVDAIADQAKKAVDKATSATDVDKIEEADKAAIKAVGEVKEPVDKTLVKDPANLTDAEKAKLLEEVKKVNPTAKEVKYDEDGNIEVTTQNGDKGTIKPADIVKTEDDLDNGKGGNDINKPIDKVIVKDPANLTDAEKAKIVDEVKAVNPNSIVTIDDKGTVTVSTPDGETAAIPAAELVRTKEDTTKPDAGNSNVVKPADKVVGEATDPAAQAKVEEKLKDLNPTAKSVKFDEKGNATVTLNDGTTATIPAKDLFKSPEEAAQPNAGNDIVKPADKAVVKDPANLTDAEKKAIEDKVKAVNPGATVVVDDKGNATVTTPEGKTAVIPATDLVKSPEEATKPNAGNDIVKPADKTVAANPEKLTDAEKKAIEDKVKAVNPGATVVVDDKGNATVTTPEGKTAVVPAADVTKSAADADKANAGNVVNTPAGKVEVKDPAKLTDEEKAKVKKAVEDVNPGSKVVVDDKGNATVTTPEGKTAVVPAADVTKSAADAGKANAGNAVNTPATRVLVGDKAKLTDEEKAKVKKAVEDVNPGSKVVVDDKGNATVTTEDGKTATIPAAQLVKDAKDVAAKNNGENINLDFEKETVVDFNNLTDAEKESAKAKIKGANADVVEVIFDKAGNATVITKDGKVYTIVAKDIFKQRPYVPSNGGGNNSGNGNGTSGNNAANNTDAKVDKAKLEGAIHQLDELIIKESAKLDVETAKEANTLLSDAKKVFANADATQAEVDAMVKRIEDFMAKVAPSTDHANTSNDQSAQTPAVVPANNQSAQTTVVAPATTQAAANASQTASAQANARKAAKELPNTGTADSTVAMVAAAASALLGLGLAGRRRKEDEEA